MPKAWTTPGTGPWASEVAVPEAVIESESICDCWPAVAPANPESQPCWV